jgi:hypothetical protein
MEATGVGRSDLKLQDIIKNAGESRNEMRKEDTHCDERLEEVLSKDRWDFVVDRDDSVLGLPTLWFLVLEKVEPKPILEPMGLDVRSSDGVPKVTAPM